MVHDGLHRYAGHIRTTVVTMMIMIIILCYVERNNMVTL